MFNFVLSIMLTILKILLGYVFLYLLYKFTKINLKNRIKTKHCLKFKYKHFLWHLRNERFINTFEFIKWVLIDLFRGKDYLRLYGIWAFTGYYGEGKTMGCVQFAHMLQEKYPTRDIKIYSNINIRGQVKRIVDWEELLELPPNSIFIYDESQADFSCNNREFPDDLLRRITQCRKRQFAMFMTSPVFNRMNINIRESVNFVIVCKNIFQLDRWFKYTFYHSEDYEQYRENKLKLMQNKHMSMSYVVQDKDYKLYNTVEEVTSIKTDDVKINKKDTPMISDILKKFRNDILKEIDYKYKEVIKS